MDEAKNALESVICKKKPMFKHSLNDNIIDMFCVCAALQYKHVNLTICGLVFFSIYSIYVISRSR